MKNDAHENAWLKRGMDTEVFLYLLYCYIQQKTVLKPSRAARPGHLAYGVANALQAISKTLIHGDTPV